MNDFSEKYLNLVNTKYSGLNLTRILDSNEFYIKQYIDSIFPFTEIKRLKDCLNEKKILVDIGFGGGFPILPLANEFKPIKFIGFEAREKKVKAVTAIANELKLSNVRLFHERLENIDFNMACVITLKAVGTIEEFLPKINCSEDSKVIFYKSENVENQENLKIHGWKIECIEVDIKEGLKRKIVICEKVPNITENSAKYLKTKKNYSQPSLVRLSSFVE
jgi:16S rRNA (guanine527-N7)-methyltransferase